MLSLNSELIKVLSVTLDSFKIEGRMQRGTFFHQEEQTLLMVDDSNQLSLVKGLR